MKRLILTLVVFSLLAIALPAAAQENTALDSLDCPFNTPPGVNVECGYLSVPQDRASADTTMLRIAYAVFRSEAANASADPVFFLQGGPGGGAVSLAPILYDGIIAPITAERDFVIFDQRGTGISEPALNCSEFDSLTTDQLLGRLAPEEMLPTYLEATAACRERLANEAGVDPAAYTSVASAADIADLADALGYDIINLYGGSYGTHLALTFIRDYPERVRSAVLDSVSPLEINRAEQQAAKTGLALDEMFSACAADAACSAAYPDLETVFYDTYAALNENPGSLEFTDLITGETLTATVTGDLFVSGIFFALQSSGQIAAIPQTIYAVQGGDYSGLIPSFQLPLALLANLNVGVFLSIFCTEEILAATPEALDASFDSLPELRSFSASVLYGSGAAGHQVCQTWGAAPFDPREGEAVSTDLPALLISGQFDPATPPEWAEQAALNLSSSYNFVVPGEGHTPSVLNPCAQQLVIDFIADPTTAPDSACLAELPVSFITPEGGLGLTFEQVESEMFAYTGIIPSNWQEAAPGVYARASGEVLLQQAIPGTLDDAVALLSGQLGFDEFPAAVGTRTANGLEWTLYQFEFQGVSVQLALAESASQTYLVLVQTPPNVADAYQTELFFPIIDALTPNS